MEAGRAAVDLVCSALALCPARRPTAGAALAARFFEGTPEPGELPPMTVPGGAVAAGQGCHEYTIFSRQKSPAMRGPTVSPPKGRGY